MELQAVRQARLDARDFGAVWAVGCLAGLFTGVLVDDIYSLSDWYDGGLSGFGILLVLGLGAPSTCVSFVLIKEGMEDMGPSVVGRPGMTAAAIIGFGAVAEILMVAGGGAVGRLGWERAGLWCLPLGLLFAWSAGASPRARWAALAAFVALVGASVVP